MVGPFEKQPPQDLAAEQSVLGGMMLSKDAIADVVEVLTPGDFYRPAHQAVYDCVLDLYGRGEPADPITVSAELERRGELGRVGGAPYLHTLIATVPTAANAGYYAEIVAEKAVLRRLVEAGTRIVQMGYNGAEGAEIDEVVDRAQAAIYEVTERRMSEDYVSLEELLQPTMDEIDAIASRGGSALGVPTGFADLDEMTNGLHPGQMIIVAARPGVGKALALDTPLATPDGWATMGGVRIGDQLIGADGRPTPVVAVTDVMTGRPCFEVEFSDGTVIVADAEHQWLTETRASRRSARQAASGHHRQRDQRTFAAVRTTAEIAASLRCPTADARCNHSVVNAGALELPERTVPVTPYLLGVWLGDGHTAAARFTTHDPEIVCYLEADGYQVTVSGPHVYSIRLPDPPEISLRACVVCGVPFRPQTSQVRTCGRSCGARARYVSAPVDRPTCPDCGRPSSGLRLCQDCRDRHGTVQAILRDAGLLGNKHIPTAYLRASQPQRRALLAGLLDTDGTVTPGGAVQFCVTNQRLAEDVYELVVSLGYRCSMTTKKVKGRSPASSTAYTLTFSTTDDVFRLERKRFAHKERAGRTSRSGSRFIVDVRPVPSVPVRCVQVAATDHRYLAGRSMVPTHNSTLGLDWARSCSVKHGMTSVIFSLEMSRTEIVMRMLSAEAKIRLQDMRGGRMSDDDWTRLARRMSEISEAPLYIDDSPNLTMMEIRAKARRLKQRNDLRLIIVDYLQLMTSGKWVESRQQEVSEFSRNLKLLAKELEVPVVAISQLNRGPEQRTDKRPMLSDLRESGCLTSGTRILCADTGAETTLGEIMSSGAQPLVWSVDDRLRLVPRPMVKVFPSGVKEVFRLRLASGREIEATGNHPFLTVDGWVPLRELAMGGRLAVPRTVPAPLQPSTMPAAEVVLLGHLIGDGSFVRRQPIRYASTDEANLTAVTEAAKHFGITAVRDDHPAARCTSLRLPAPYRLTHGKRNPIAAWLDGFGLFGLRSHEKFVPAPVFSLSDEQVALFLHHLWATDGSVRWDEKYRQGWIYYATTSRRLADDVVNLLLRVGVSTRVKFIKKVGYRDCYHVCIYGAENQLRFLDTVGVHGDRGIRARQLADELRQLDQHPKADTVPNAVWNRVRELLAARSLS
ncbi:MAG TPA: replicative DNA helicase, partial [Pseudonocardiaceae bacterium]|nr:replicative DNA helicase [Pseudonocardiaceae bacterium]